MRHNYRRIVAYDPVSDRVTVCKELGEDYIFQEKWLDEAFYEVLGKTDRMNEVVLGFSLANDMYQLSPAPYGTYVKEDFYTAQDINKSRVLVAVDKYRQKHHIKYE